VGLPFYSYYAKKETHGTQSMGFFFFSYFLFLPPTPNPLPSGKRALRFASPGSCPPPLPLQLSSYRAADVNPLVLALSFSYSSFYFPLIDVGLFKDRVVAMGKPHCNSSI
jgi:hypothetical protein